MGSIADVRGSAPTSGSGKTVPTVKVGATTAEPQSNTNADSGNSVEISAQAKQLAKWDSLSDAQRRALYDNTWNAFLALDRASVAPGQPARGDLPDDADPDRLALAQQAVAYNFSIRSSPPGQVPNPFAGVDRDELTSIIYDDSGTYTVSERYAACSEQQRQDYVTLSKLFAQTTNGGDNRIIYKGLLDYFDALSPIERSIYPADYRDKLTQLLQDQESQYGTLGQSGSNKPTAAPTNPALKPGEPIATQLIAFVNKDS